MLIKTNKRIKYKSRKIKNKENNKINKVKIKVIQY